MCCRELDNHYFLIGALVFVPVFACIQSYTQAHLNEFMQVLQGS